MSADFLRFAANGNAGAAGIYSGDSPAVGSDVFAVGSVDNDKYPVTFQYAPFNTVIGFED